MKYLFKISLLVSILFFSLKVFSQEENTDTTVSFYGTYNQQFQTNLDSLLRLTYVQKTISLTNPTFASEYPYTETPDSVILQRLNTLPNILEMTVNSEVQKFIRFFLKNNKTKTEIMIGLAQHYLPVFDSVVRANGLPLELKYLPISESNMFPRAVSLNGANGYWQLMYTISKMYGLDVDTQIDERRNLVLASNAAMEYLVDMYNIYNDWYLVIAAYNCGAGNVNKAIQRSGGKTDIWAIYNYLPQDTREYIPAYIATIYIMNFYQLHGLTPIKAIPPTDNATVFVTQKTHLGQIAKVLNLDYNDLRDRNLIYKKDIVPVFIDSNSVVIPKNAISQFYTLEDSIYSFCDSVYFQQVQFVSAPAVRNTSSSSSSSSSETYDYEPPTIEGKTKLTYTVKSGDNVSLIAAWYGVKIADLRYWNGISSRNLINVGQQLSIYVDNAEADKYRRVNSMTFTQKQAFAGLSSGSSSSTSSSSSSSSSSSTTRNSNVPQNGDYIYYTILQGDNLWNIAKHYPGVTAQSIMDLNGFTDSDVRDLKVGQVIKIKRR